CRSFGGGFQDWHCRRTCSTFPAHTARFHWRVVHMRSAQAHTACGTRANTNTSTKTAARPRTHRETALHSVEWRISAKADKSNNNQFESNVFGYFALRDNERFSIGRFGRTVRECPKMYQQ